MIVTKLMGGLGNQMFQYAGARALALRKNTWVYLDRSFLETDPGGQWTKRDFELDVFRIQHRTEENGTVKFLRKLNSNRYLRKISSLWPLPYKNFSEKGMEFQPELFDCPANTYLDGYFQTAKYYEGVEDMIREDFRFVHEPGPANQQIIEKISAMANPVSIHIRRGDYVNLASANAYHGVCGLDYYHKAVAYLSVKISPSAFFVFSDDQEWVRANLSLPGEVIFVDFNTGKESYNDLRLMSLCRHNIIANSSFSWWGAWLNQHKEKTVIAPEKWFQSSEKNYSDLIPASWIQL